MADKTVRDQADDARKVGKALLNYDFEDMVFGFASGLASSDQRLGNDYIAAMNKIIYTQSSISRVVDALASSPVGSLIGGGNRLGADLLAATDDLVSDNLEVAYIDIKVEKPVVDPNGMTTITNIDLRMPRFLVYDKKPLSVKDARISFGMNIETVYDKQTEITKSKTKDNDGTWGRALSFKGSISRSRSEKVNLQQTVNSTAQVEVEVNFAASDEQPVAHQILGDLFREIATPISG